MSKNHPKTPLGHALEAIELCERLSREREESNAIIEKQNEVIALLEQRLKDHPPVSAEVLAAYKLVHECFEDTLDGCRFHRDGAVLTALQTIEAHTKEPKRWTIKMSQASDFGQPSGVPFKAQAYDDTGKLVDSIYTAERTPWTVESGGKKVEVPTGSTLTTTEDGSWTVYRKDYLTFTATENGTWNLAGNAANLFEALGPGTHKFYPETNHPDALFARLGAMFGSPIDMEKLDLYFRNAETNAQILDELRSKLSND